MEEKFELVEERIWLVERLIESSSHFIGREYLKDLGGGWDHPYKHYSALRNYLILTCFDILGQPAEWVDFNTWLVSSKKKREREIIVSELQTQDPIEIAKKLHEGYTSLYGVKNSFFKFMREVLSEENREKLFQSIQVMKTTQNPVFHSDGSVTSGLSMRVKLENEKIEKLLFKIRNEFTHKGVSLSSGAGGLFPGYDTYGVKIPGEKAGYFSLFMHSENIQGVHHEFNSVGWPNILIEIVKETLIQMRNKK